MSEADYFTVIVSLLSAIIAVVAILKSIEANKLAKQANDLATHFNLRPPRLEAYNAFRDFAHFCTTYRTKFLQAMVEGTGPLMSRRDDFLNQMDALGPLQMPEVSEKVIEYSNKAVQLQRALDRSRGSEPKPLDNSFATLEENIDAIMDWFAAEEKGLEGMFNRYLGDA